jgi:hypothetical protein
MAAPRHAGASSKTGSPQVNDDGTCGYVRCRRPGTSSVFGDSVLRLLDAFINAGLIFAYRHRESTIATARKGVAYKPFDLAQQFFHIGRVLLFAFGINSQVMRGLLAQLPMPRQSATHIWGGVMRFLHPPLTGAVGSSAFYQENARRLDSVDYRLQTPPTRYSGASLLHDPAKVSF